MWAMLSRAAGGPHSLEMGDAPMPAVGEGQVLVKVRACGVNYPDLLLLSDRYQFRPERPFSPGSEVSGEIVALANGVTSCSIGDRVIALPGWGGMAEFVAVDARSCLKIPDTMPFDDAAAFLFTYGTAYHALVQRGGAASGKTLLVLGAGGGVGLAAVELGAALGARVVAAASSTAKADLAREFGAVASYVYPIDPSDEHTKQLAADFKQLCGQNGADLVFDGVGGAYAEPAARALAWKGRYLVIGFPAGVPQLALNLPLLKGAEIVGVFFGAFTTREPDCARRNELELLGLYSEGKVKPRISRRFPMAEASAALELMEQRRATGKIVLLSEEA